MADVEVLEMETETDDVTEQQEPEAPTPETGDTVEFWKAQARKQEKRAKANAEAAKQLEAATAETARLQEELQQLTARVAQYESREAREGWIGKAVDAYGMTADAYRLLDADDEAAFMTKAEQLSKVCKPPVPVVQGDGNHTESPMSTATQEFARKLFNRD